MCELFSKLEASDWAGIIQAICAIIASIFLFFTFYSQKKSAEIEKKSKRGEHLPKFHGTVNANYPTVEDGYGGSFEEPFNGEDSTIIVNIEFKENPIQLNDFNFVDQKKQIVNSIDKTLFDSKRILVPGESIEVKYSINFKSYFDVKDNFSFKGGSALVECGLPNYRSEITLDSVLYFSDVLGNKYELSYCIIDLVKVEITKLKMID